MMSPTSSMSLARYAMPAMRTVVLLPEVDTYVDPANPAKSFAGEQLVVSADQNQPQKIVYVRFDLSPIPPTATITACQFYFTVAQQVTKQVVKLRLVDNDTWTENITFNTAPKATVTAIGTWEAESTQRVTTNDVNPVLVREVQKKLAGQDHKLSIQISSTFGQEKGATANTYCSFEKASAAGTYASGPRLVVQYQPVAQPLARDWEQRQADARHSGRSPWVFANTPTENYLAETVFSGVQLSSPAVIRDELLYLFTPTALQILNPAGGALQPLVSGLAEFVTLALGPNGVLYAAAKSELSAFDLTAGGRKIVSLPLANLSSEITAGADGSVYLAQGSTLFAYVQRLGTLAPAWSKDLGTDVLSQVTLTADGSVAHVATANHLYALYTADGSEKWRYPLDGAPASHLTTPVVGSANGLSYFGVDEKLYVFGDYATPVSDDLGFTGRISQPVIDANDTLYVVQGTELYAVTPDGLRRSSVTVSGATVTIPVKPVMDGAGNLFFIDNQVRLFVFRPDLQPGSGPQTLRFAFGGSQPSLQVAPNGSLFCASDSALFRLNPGVAASVTVSAYADATSYRAASSLVLEGAAVPAAASVVFQSGGTVSIKPGFSVPSGTEAVFNVGY